MKIFLTVGTTAFDPLVRFVDNKILDHELIIQKADGSYIPKNHPSFKFKKDIREEIKQADVVICHAGAGTIYSLLEQKKKIIVIPNLKRIDKHQVEIANFVAKSNLGFVCKSFEDLPKFLSKIQETQFTPYEKKEFFLSEFILSQLKI